jgi:predicted  nucleic acid-binding Zn-ribbon protein
MANTRYQIETDEDKPKPGRPPLEPRISALQERSEALQRRIEQLERRIEEMDEAFSRGVLPPTPIRTLA